MRIPTIRGVIDRRVLANYRVDPETLAKALPAPFRPQVVSGFGIAGICLIRLKQIRMQGLPALFGFGSENAAHRIAVEWEQGNELRTGVFIPRRDTSSWLNTFTGGRIFPGVHHRARFEVRETDSQVHIEMQSVDGAAHVLVDGKTTERLPSNSVFASVAESSQFFEAGSLGYSPGRIAGSYDGLELRTFNWSVQPLAVDCVESSLFDNSEAFPAGSATFDHALLMRGIDHQWHSRDALCCPEEVVAASANSQ